jgi:hypothetical protein
LNGNNIAKKTYINYVKIDFLLHTFSLYQCQP